MFTVLFEVHPSTEKKPLYLDIGKALRPELLQIDGFIDNIRYASLTKPGWILSLSTWRDEKSLVRWRTQGRHHSAQQQGRAEVFHDYRLRICEVTADTHIPEGHKLEEQRLDITRTGDAEAIVLISMNETALQNPHPNEVLELLNLEVDPLASLVSWDIFEAVLSPGDVIAYLSFKTSDTSSEFIRAYETKGDVRLRQERVIRDYGMYDRYEAPQYYPEVQRRS
ncbi:uncharacterized protein TRIVIDRAFT_222865 [Trichoderma virens Gv29-8]|uniref:ABM domain-containing protein n=1 Tax=Hypocrea virens (strain Gv29-8 / FGSC 10586) TaxID=413071 RepID=G9MVA6_HYPVG|nr:uncharacterized protein TRIVIDRAFT_222865 [Trichoderma virens Gv29-8]EHK21623.1 hypothetical protein TRIVIDRAFT_222865 [Trichoderma virens Gv29-8]UKZ51063.1 hypothetical protein TrVGV298_004818 [Trichoderma virens]